MYKKIIAIAMAATLAASVPVFADVQTRAVNTAATESQTAAVSAGVKPDIPLYILDRLVEKIQIALISDAVKETEALAKLTQEMPAESKAMLEANNVELGKKVLEEYEKLMGKAVNVVDAAVKKWKAVSKAVDTIAKYSIQDEEMIGNVVEKVPEQYREDLKQAIANLPEKEAAEPSEKDS